MNQIIASVKDPGWWFSVFFAGIIVSILSGFLKDWVANAAAKYLHIFRERRKAKAVRREALYEALASNEGFLILSMVRLMGLMIISLLMLSLFVSMPMLLEVKDTLCRVATRPISCSASYVLISKISISVSGIVAMIVNYMASSRFSLVMTGLRRYRERAGLPRVV